MKYLADRVVLPGSDDPGPALLSVCPASGKFDRIDRLNVEELAELRREANNGVIDFGDCLIMPGVGIP